MRLRIVVLGSLLSAVAAVMTAAPVSAAPHHNRGLTISAAPNPAIAGEGVVIWGQLRGNDVAGQTIRLYHRINPSHTFSLISVTKTIQGGFYEFTRAEGIVYTNRNWYVTGPSGTHSRTIHERVSALVSLHASQQTAMTRQPVLFTGHVTPGHAGQRVYLQAQKPRGDDWRTLTSGVLGPASNYAISFRWRVPGERTLRVVLPRDPRNIRSESDPVMVTVEQRQIPSFTINSSDPVIGVGQKATISGTLYKPGGNTPDPNTPVTLCSKSYGDPLFNCNTAGVTNGSGDYGFLVQPEHNTLYLVRVTLTPRRHTARLFEGVQDAVTLTSSTSNAIAGQPVLFTGTVTPDQAGDTVYLQRYGADGDWHTIAISTVHANSTFYFVRRFGNPGPKMLRARVLSDPLNVGNVSPALTVNVTLPPVSSLSQSG